LRIVITGATGRVGSQISPFIDAQQHQIVLALRNTSKKPQDTGQTVLFDFEKPSTFAPALKGCDSLFLMRPPTTSNPNKALEKIVDEAIAAKVQRIVYLSVLGADRNKLLPHRANEDYIKASGIPYTLLRASFFMQNLSSVHQADIQANHTLFLPAGKGKTSFIDTRDIAAVAAKALTEPGHAGKAYNLTGSESLDYYQVAEIFTDVLQRPITYSNPSVLEFVVTMLQRGTPLAFVLVMSGIYSTVRFGLAGELYPDTAEVLGRSPISLSTFVRDYQNCWQKTESHPLLAQSR
jgi:uncharacterized protein YbjT (DUF2867 family)